MRYDLNHPLFQKAMPVLNKIEEAGYKAYFVGGCVRDTLLNREIHDIDIASSAFPHEIEAMFHHTIDLGKDHGTIIVVYNSETFEITTFRVESSYSDFRRPDSVSFVRNLREDTLRRDFTINALAFDNKGKLLDYHGGLSDLNNKIIRAVGNPEERFLEDALRIIRAVRFSSQLGFEIEEFTLNAMIKLCQHIQYLSIERINVEFTKFLQGNHFIENYKYLFSSHLAQYLPEINKFNLKTGLHSLACILKAYYQENNTISERLIWGLLLYTLNCSPLEAKQILKTWKHSNKNTNDICQIVHFINLVDAKTVNIFDVYQIPQGLINEVQIVINSMGIDKRNKFSMLKANLPIQNRAEIKIQGNDIIDLLNLNKGGPIIGEILNDIESNILEGVISNDKNIIQEWVKDKYKS